MNAAQLDRAFRITFLIGALVAVGSGLLGWLAQKSGPFWPLVTLDLYLAGFITFVSICSFFMAENNLQYGHDRNQMLSSRCRSMAISSLPRGDKI